MTTNNCYQSKAAERGLNDKWAACFNVCLLFDISQSIRGFTYLLSAYNGALIPPILRGLLIDLLYRSENLSKDAYEQ